MSAKRPPPAAAAPPRAPAQAPAPSAAWSGRFSGSPAEIMQRINVSIEFDKRLYAQDIAASLAHAAMLVEQGILGAEDGAAIARGLEQIRAEIEAGTFPFRAEHEDIHLNIEARLTELIGPAAGRLHTARSRNDQVATDFKLWVRDAIDRLDRALMELQGALIDRAEEHAATIMPGFTHLQVAQPVTFGHHLLAYVEMVGRDRARFADARKRLNESPLGAAALAGTSFPIDRDKTARALGFDRPAANSIDAVSDRDFALEFLAAAAIAAMHLSRFAEEVVIWTSAPFGLVHLSDAFTTGSSIMPQKRNPDAAELVRAKAARLAGSLAGLLSVMKGLPLAYAKDMQEDKVPVFEAADTLELTLAATSGMVRDMTADKDAMRDSGRERLQHRDRSRRLARAQAGSPVPRGASHHRRAGAARGGAEMRARRPAARRHAAGRTAHRQVGLRRALRRALGRKPHELRRHRARCRRRRGRGGAQAVSAMTPNGTRLLRRFAPAMTRAVIASAAKQSLRGKLLSCAPPRSPPPARRVRQEGTARAAGGRAQHLSTAVSQ